MKKRLCKIPSSLWLAVLGMAGLGAAQSAALAAGPVVPLNDALAKATLITGMQLTLSQQAGPKATAERGEPAIDAMPAKNTTWYRLISPQFGCLTITWPDSAGARATIWEATRQGRTFAELKSNVTNLGVLAGQQRRYHSIVPGKTYLVQVDSAAPVDMSFWLGKQPYDRAASAQVQAGGSVGISVYPGFASSNEDENVYRDGADAGWLAWTPAMTGEYLVDTLYSKGANGLGADGAFCVYSGNPFTGLVELAQGVSIPGATGRQATVQLTAGQTYYVSAGRGTDGKPGDTVSVLGNLNNSPGALDWENWSRTVSENVGSVTLRVNRLNGTKGTISCKVTAMSQSATKGVDFLWAADKTLTFADGERTKEVVVPIVSDAMDDEDEQFGLVMSNATGGATISQPNASVTIKDGTAPDSAVAIVPFDFLPDSEDVMVEGYSYNIMIQRTGSVKKSASVWISGPGVAGDSQQVFFYPGQSFAQVWVSPPNDFVFLGSQYVQYSLENPEGTSLDTNYSQWGGSVSDDDAYVPTAGRYAILASSQMMDSVMVELVLTNAGSFTGKLRQGGASYPVKGALDSHGLCLMNVARGTLQPLNLRLAVLNSMGRLQALVRDLGTVGPQVVLGADYPLVANAVSNPSPHAGLFNTASNGLATVGTPLPVCSSCKVAPSGKVTAAGFNMDNTPFTFSGDLNSLGKVAILVPTHAGKGYVSGMVPFNVPMGGSAQDTLRHYKPANTKDVVYPGGYDFDLAHKVCRYTPPTAGNRVLNDLNTSNGAAKAKFLQGEAIANDTTYDIVVDAKNKVTVPMGLMTMTITPATGSVAGTVKAADGKMKPFRGVVMNALNLISGNVTGPSSASQFTVKK